MVLCRAVMVICEFKIAVNCDDNLNSAYLRLIL